MVAEELMVAEEVEAQTAKIKEKATHREVLIRLEEEVEGGD